MAESCTYLALKYKPVHIPTYIPNTRLAHWAGIFGVAQALIWLAIHGALVILYFHSKEYWYTTKRLRFFFSILIDRNKEKYLAHAFYLINATYTGLALLWLVTSALLLFYSCKARDYNCGCDSTVCIRCIARLLYLLWALITLCISLLDLAAAGFAIYTSVYPEDMKTLIKKSPFTPDKSSGFFHNLFTLWNVLGYVRSPRMARANDTIRQDKEDDFMKIWKKPQEPPDGMTNPQNETKTNASDNFTDIVNQFLKKYLAKPKSSTTSSILKEFLGHFRHPNDLEHLEQPTDSPTTGSSLVESRNINQTIDDLVEYIEKILDDELNQPNRPFEPKPIDDINQTIEHFEKNILMILEDALKQSVTKNHPMNFPHPAEPRDSSLSPEIDNPVEPSWNVPPWLVSKIRNVKSKVFHSQSLNHFQSMDEFEQNYLNNLADALKLSFLGESPSKPRTSNDLPGIPPNSVREPQNSPKYSESAFNFPDQNLEKSDETEQVFLSTLTDALKNAYRKNSETPKQQTNRNSIDFVETSTKSQPSSGQKYVPHKSISNNLNSRSSKNILKLLIKKNLNHSNTDEYSQEPYRNLRTAPMKVETYMGKSSLKNDVPQNAKSDQDTSKEDNKYSGSIQERQKPNGAKIFEKSSQKPRNLDSAQVFENIADYSQESFEEVHSPEPDLPEKLQDFNQDKFSENILDYSQLTPEKLENSQVVPHKSSEKLEESSLYKTSPQNFAAPAEISRGYQSNSSEILDDSEHLPNDRFMKSWNPPSEQPLISYYMNTNFDDSESKTNLRSESDRNNFKTISRDRSLRKLSKSLSTQNGKPSDHRRKNLFNVQRKKRQVKKNKRNTLSALMEKFKQLSPKLDLNEAIKNFKGVNRSNLINLLPGSHVKEESSGLLFGLLWGGADYKTIVKLVLRPFIFWFLRCIVLWFINVVLALSLLCTALRRFNSIKTGATYLMNAPPYTMRRCNIIYRIFRAICRTICCFFCSIFRFICWGFHRFIVPRNLCDTYGSPNTCGPVFNNPCSSPGEMPVHQGNFHEPYCDCGGGCSPVCGYANEPDCQTIYKNLCSGRSSVTELFDVDYGAAESVVDAICKMPSERPETPPDPPVVKEIPSTLVEETPKTVTRSNSCAEKCCQVNQIKYVRPCVSDADCCHAPSERINRRAPTSKITDFYLDIETSEDCDDNLLQDCPISNICRICGRPKHKCKCNHFGGFDGPELKPGSPALLEGRYDETFNPIFGQSCETREYNMKGSSGIYGDNVVNCGYCAVPNGFFNGTGPNHRIGGGYCCDMGDCNDPAKFAAHREYGNCADCKYSNNCSGCTTCNNTGCVKFTKVGKSFKQEFTYAGNFFKCCKCRYCAICSNCGNCASCGECGDYSCCRHCSRNGLCGKCGLCGYCGRCSKPKKCGEPKRHGFFKRLFGRRSSNKIFDICDEEESTTPNTCYGNYRLCDNCGNLAICTFCGNCGNCGPCGHYGVCEKCRNHGCCSNCGKCGNCDIEKIPDPAPQSEYENMKCAYETCKYPKKCGCDKCRKINKCLSTDCCPQDVRQRHDFPIRNPRSEIVTCKKRSCKTSCKPNCKSSCKSSYKPSTGNPVICSPTSKDGPTSCEDLCLYNRCKCRGVCKCGYLCNCACPKNCLDPSCCGRGPVPIPVSYKQNFKIPGCFIKLGDDGKDYTCSYPAKIHTPIVPENCRPSDDFGNFLCDIPSMISDCNSPEWKCCRPIDPCNVRREWRNPAETSKKYSGKAKDSDRPAETHSSYKKHSGFNCNNNDGYKNSGGHNRPFVRKNPARNYGNCSKNECPAGRVPGNYRMPHGYRRAGLNYAGFCAGGYGSITSYPDCERPDACVGDCEKFFDRNLPPDRQYSGYRNYEPGNCSNFENGTFDDSETSSNRNNSEPNGNYPLPENLIKSVNFKRSDSIVDFEKFQNDSNQDNLPSYENCKTCGTRKICTNCGNCASCGNVRNYGICGNCGEYGICGKCGNCDNCNTCGNCLNYQLCGNCGNYAICSNCSHCGSCGTHGNFTSCKNCGDFGSCSRCGICTNCKYCNVCNTIGCTNCENCRIIYGSNGIILKSNSSLKRIPSGSESRDSQKCANNTFRFCVGSPAKNSDPVDREDICKKSKSSYDCCGDVSKPAKKENLNSKKCKSSYNFTEQQCNVCKNSTTFCICDQCLARYIYVKNCSTCKQCAMPKKFCTCTRSKDLDSTCKVQTFKEPASSLGDSNYRKSKSNHQSGGIPKNCTTYGCKRCGKPKNLCACICRRCKHPKKSCICGDCENCNRPRKCCTCGNCPRCGWAKSSCVCGSDRYKSKKSGTPKNKNAYQTCQNCGNNKNCCVCDPCKKCGQPKILCLCGKCKVCSKPKTSCICGDCEHCSAPKRYCTCDKCKKCRQVKMDCICGTCKKCGQPKNCCVCGKQTTSAKPKRNSTFESGQPWEMLEDRCACGNKKNSSISKRNDTAYGNDRQLGMMKENCACGNRQTSSKSKRNGIGGNDQQWGMIEESCACGNRQTSSKSKGNGIGENDQQRGMMKESCACGNRQTSPKPKRNSVYRNCQQCGMPEDSCVCGKYKTTSKSKPNVGCGKCQQCGMPEESCMCGNCKKCGNPKQCCTCGICQRCKQPKNYCICGNCQRCNRPKNCCICEKCQQCNRLKKNCICGFCQQCKRPKNCCICGNCQQCKRPKNCCICRYCQQCQRPKNCCICEQCPQCKRPKNCCICRYCQQCKRPKNCCICGICQQCKRPKNCCICGFCQQCKRPKNCCICGFCQQCKRPKNCCICAKCQQCKLPKNCCICGICQQCKRPKNCCICANCQRCKRPKNCCVCRNYQQNKQPKNCGISGNYQRCNQPKRSSICFASSCKPYDIFGICQKCGQPENCCLCSKYKGAKSENNCSDINLNAVDASPHCRVSKSGCVCGNCKQCNELNDNCTKCGTRKTHCLCSSCPQCGMPKVYCICCKTCGRAKHHCICVSKERTHITGMFNLFSREDVRFPKSPGQNKIKRKDQECDTKKNCQRCRKPPKSCVCDRCLKCCRPKTYCICSKSAQACNSSVNNPLCKSCSQYGKSKKACYCTRCPKCHNPKYLCTCKKYKTCRPPIECFICRQCGKPKNCCICGKCQKCGKPKNYCVCGRYNRSEGSKFRVATRTHPNEQTCGQAIKGNDFNYVCCNKPDTWNACCPIPKCNDPENVFNCENHDPLKCLHFQTQFAPEDCGDSVFSRIGGDAGCNIDYDDQIPTKQERTSGDLLPGNRLTLTVSECFNSSSNDGKSGNFHDTHDLIVYLNYCKLCSRRKSSCLCYKCQKCGRLKDECTCEHCLTCLRPKHRCVCDKCLKCFMSKVSCVCPKCLECGMPDDCCICGNCEVCGRIKIFCTCEKCQVCGRPENVCICEKCQGCSRPKFSCICGNCPNCYKPVHFCVCGYCEECGRPKDRCICGICQRCCMPKYRCTCNNCVKCGRSKTFCTCGLCEKCSMPVNSCICGDFGDCRQCGRPLVSCICEKCIECGRHKIFCVCKTCRQCGVPKASCVCPKCLICGLTEDSCVCGRSKESCDEPNDDTSENCLICGMAKECCVCYDCSQCSRPLERCICGRCQKCGHPKNSCTCEGCKKCGKPRGSCTCGRCQKCGKSPDCCVCRVCEKCGNTSDCCVCKICERCGKRLSFCICGICKKCGMPENCCICGKCEKCGRSKKKCLCDKCRKCYLPNSCCICERCQQCEMFVENCVCMACQNCGRLKTGCLCSKCKECGKSKDCCMCTRCKKCKKAKENCICDTCKNCCRPKKYCICCANKKYKRSNVCAGSDLCGNCGKPIDLCVCGTCKRCEKLRKYCVCPKCKKCGYFKDSCVCPKCKKCGKSNKLCVCEKCKKCRKIKECCTCSCQECGKSAAFCLCAKCKKCGRAKKFCVCTECHRCKNPKDQCVCDKCKKCFKSKKYCICADCQECGYPKDCCLCEKCQTCERPKKLCICEDCSQCKRPKDCCVCRTCKTCGMLKCSCVCSTCKNCGKVFSRVKKSGTLSLFSKSGYHFIPLKQSNYCDQCTILCSEKSKKSSKTSTPTCNITEDTNSCSVSPKKCSSQKYCVLDTCPSMSIHKSPKNSTTYCRSQNYSKSSKSSLNNSSIKSQNSGSRYSTKSPNNGPRQVSKKYQKCPSIQKMGLSLDSSSQTSFFVPSIRTYGQMFTPSKQSISLHRSATIPNISITNSHYIKCHSCKSRCFRPRSCKSERTIDFIGSQQYLKILNQWEHEKKNILSTLPLLKNLFEPCKVEVTEVYVPSTCDLDSKRNLGDKLFNLLKKK